MIYSYLGLSKPASFVNLYIRDILEDYIKLNGYEEIPLQPGGVFTTNPADSIQFAAANDMCVFLNADDLFAKSDIIMVFLPESALKNLSKTLKGHGIRNKILIHFNPGFNADVLDFGFENTYISSYFLIHEKGFQRMFIQGYGDLYNDFLTMCRIICIPFVELNSIDKMLLTTAAGLSDVLSETINDAVEKLIRISLYHNSEITESVIDMLKIKTADLNSYNPVKRRNLSFIDNQIETLDDAGIDSLSLLIGFMYITECNKSSSKHHITDKIMELGRKLLKKN
ncbi:MAG: hypothetical protein II998_05075 [Clostridia bacterium]|nr:hypothetical protein [Clostridia bacterium]